MSDQTPPPPPPTTPPPPSGGFSMDPKEAKANAKAQKAHARALRPWYKKKRFMIPLVLVALLIIIQATSGGGDDKTDTSDTAASPGETTTTADSGIDTNSENTTNKPQDDLGTAGTDWECTTDDIGFATAKGTLTNKSSGTSTYIIEVTFTADGVQYATGTALVNNVASGVKAEWEANSVNENRAGSTCEITDVNRFAS